MPLWLDCHDPIKHCPAWLDFLEEITRVDAELAGSNSAQGFGASAPHTLTREQSAPGEIFGR